MKKLLKSVSNQSSKKDNLAPVSLEPLPKVILDTKLTSSVDNKQFILKIVDWAIKTQAESRDVSQVVDFDAFDHFKNGLLQMNKFTKLDLHDDKEYVETYLKH